MYRHLGDASMQIMRSHGIVPLSKWVDDHIFFRILWCQLDSYNLRHTQWAKEIADNSSEVHNRGHLWFRGATMPDGLPEEFNKDASFTIQDLSQSSER